MRVKHDVFPISDTVAPFGNQIAMRALKAHLKLFCNHVCSISATMAQLYLTIRAGLDGSA
jgi:hypothetical protein